MPGVEINTMFEGLPGAHDCAMVALHVYLGIGYDDVLRAATFHDRFGGKRGLFLKSIVAIADDLGHPLRKTTLKDDSYGLIWVPGHCAVVRDRMVLDRRESMPVGIWIKKHRRKGRVWVLTAEDE